MERLTANNVLRLCVLSALVLAFACIGCTSLERVVTPTAPSMINLPAGAVIPGQDGSFGLALSPDKDIDIQVFYEDGTPRLIAKGNRSGVLETAFAGVHDVESMRALMFLQGIQTLGSEIRSIGTTFTNLQMDVARLRRELKPPDEGPSNLDRIEGLLREFLARQQGVLTTQPSQ